MIYHDLDTHAVPFQRMPEILTVLQLSHILNISEKTAYQLVREKQINHFKIGRTYRIPKMAVLNYLNTVTGVADSQTCHT